MPTVDSTTGPVAVTGASGYIGSHCVKNLVEHGYQVSERGQRAVLCRRPDLAPRASAPRSAGAAPQRRPHRPVRCAT